MPAPILPYHENTLYFNGTVYAGMSETFFNNYPNLLINTYGFTCEAAHDYLLANIGVLAAQVIQDGYVFNNMTSGEIDLVGTASNLLFGTVDPGPDAYGGWEKSISDGFIDNTTFGWPMVINSPVRVFNIEVTGDLGGSSATINRTVPILDIGSFDFEEWWCYYSGCCAAPTFFGGRFLIPPPASPAPGEENVTTPLLYTPIYLSNHTFQFIRDFGRNK